MATNHYSNDSICTTTFTPLEYPVQILERVRDINTIICPSTTSTKSFVMVKVVQQLAYNMRSVNGQRAVYVVHPSNVEVIYELLMSLTDLKVKSVENHHIAVDEWNRIIENNIVLLMTAKSCSNLIKSDMLKLYKLNLLFFDDGTYNEECNFIKLIMNEYRKLEKKPRLIALVSGLLCENLVPYYLRGEIDILEKLLDCRLDTSCELTNLVRMSSKPKELLVLCKNSEPQLSEISKLISELEEFFKEHRYDPTEIYEQEFLEEFRNVPDPKLTPLKLINQFKHIFNEYGVWCANQAAFQVLLTIDKLKVKVAYERHYLLLCLMATCMVGVRAICEELVENQPIVETIKIHSHGKILRLIEILKEVGPEYRPEEEVVSAPPPPPDPIPPTRFGKRAYKGQRRVYHPQSEDSVSVLIFVQNTTVAKVFHSLLSNIASNDPSMSWIVPLYIADKTANPQTETKEAEGEHRKQEDVLRKFRAHECTVLIATPVLEQGYDLPKCNLVVRMDAPNSFQSYIYSKSRARTVPSFYITMAYENTKCSILKQHAEFMAVEKVLLQHSPRTEPNLENIEKADEYCSRFAPYTTVQNENVHLNTAIHLINRYCAKLPSDTFTKLVPTFSLHEDNKQAQIHLRLPINSPVKLTIVTDYYDNMAVAMRFAAFYMCQALHRFNELDDFLNPISKEHFKPADEDWNEINMEKEEEDVNYDNIDQRPGTTKRRQYYYKRIAHALKQCRPLPFKSSNFYSIVMTLTCPIPEEQNTRGRRIYPPEESKQGFGILTSTEIPQICPFPIFTRSGEVQVSLDLISDEVELTEDQAYKISEFLNYTFTSVLRLQKYQMVFDPQGAESNFYIIPTITENGITKIDFQFIELIYQNRDVLPESIPDQDRVNYCFNAKQYEDAVVMPWYRNQDQPQYFYVAEICCNLNPSSSFPGSEYSTFDEYYNRKYGIKIQNKEQYLLDVDHTSARLNFLTPRYVNRKGVALPTSSEETKRAKRENLEQKQILIPELCAIHPFPASLWRKAVCLPCILYRINALLLADEIRRTVAEDIQLGKTDLPRSFKWDSLNFGWNLSDVLKKSKNAEKQKNDTNEEMTTTEDLELEIKELTIEEVVDDENEEITENQDKNWVEIGTWSNDMVEDPNSSKTSIRYGSPTSWLHSTYGYNEYDDYSDTETYYSSDEEATVGSQCGGLHIEFQGDFLAEAVDTKKTGKNLTDLQLPKWISQGQFNDNYCTEFNKVVEQNSKYLEETAVIQPEDKFIKSLYIESPYKCKENKGELIVPDYKFKLPETKPAIVSNVIHPTVNGFSFDKQPDLSQHPGPSPNVILQALTMSNANDGINLERLETIGDSFLKYAITDYLYSKYPNTHEGKLSHLRSKQVSNLNLYRLGKKKSLGELMIATKFDPHDNWLPPGYCVSKQLEEALSRAKIPINYLTLADYIARRTMTEEELCLKIQEEGECINDLVSGMIPYNLVTQHSIPDKSIADCVEALIGGYLIDCGPRGALLFMAWLGIRVLPKLDDNSYGYLPIPYSPLLHDRSLKLPEPLANPNIQLNKLLDGYDTFENILGYNFNDRSYLLQALTHASYYENVITDCYQRLEFLGDAVLDYLITRHLYEDERMHSPGALTDLRSALVNNTIFASLAVKFNFHKYFLYLSPGLHHVIEKFIRIQEEVGHKVSEELFLLDVEENDEVEDVEVPKVLGDIFESVAGAIFLDSGRSLDAVWNVYYGMMKNEIEQFSDKVPKSPIRELLELEPETAKFGPAEKLADGRRVRVAVEVFGKGTFRGIGRNYRIAKCTAAKCALKHLKRQCARF